jgi:hypothetical protein
MSFPIDICRFCLENFEVGSNKFKINSLIEHRFTNITQIELRKSTIYSQTICEDCFQKIRSFSQFKNELIEKQMKLYRIYESVEESMLLDEEEVDEKKSLDGQELEPEPQYLALTCEVPDYLEDPESQGIIEENTDVFSTEYLIEEDSQFQEHFIKEEEYQEQIPDSPKEDLLVEAPTKRTRYSAEERKERRRQQQASYGKKT